MPRSSDLSFWLLLPNCSRRWPRGGGRSRVGAERGEQPSPRCQKQRAHGGNAEQDGAMLAEGSKTSSASNPPCSGRSTIPVPSCAFAAPPCFKLPPRSCWCRVPSGAGDPDQHPAVLRAPWQCPAGTALAAEGIEEGWWALENEAGASKGARFQLAPLLLQRLVVGIGGTWGRGCRAAAPRLEVRSCCALSLSLQSCDLLRHH